MQSTFKTDLKDGLRDTIPITLGYFAVALSLGIIGKQVGLTAFQGFLSSYFTLSSTGGFAAFLLIGDNAPYVEMAIMMLVVNARYLLMGASLTQRLDPAAPFWHRLLIAQGITDEIFGVSVARKDFVRLPYSLAVIIPASKKDRFTAAVVAVSMAASLIFTCAPVLRSISSGFRVIILTIVIAGAAAAIRPVDPEEV